MICHVSRVALHGARTNDSASTTLNASTVQRNLRGRYGAGALTACWSACLHADQYTLEPSMEASRERGNGELRCNRPRFCRTSGTSIVLQSLLLAAAHSKSSERRTTTCCLGERCPTSVPGAHMGHTTGGWATLAPTASATAAGVQQRKPPVFAGRPERHCTGQAVFSALKGPPPPNGPSYGHGIADLWNGHRRQCRDEC